MSRDCIKDIVRRAKAGDPSLIAVDSISVCQYTDAELAEFVDCLLVRPNLVARLHLNVNKLTDETGVKVARCLASSSSVKKLNLAYNRVGLPTYLAIAVALRTNSSMEILRLYANRVIDKIHVDAAFIKALRLNPHRPADSKWCLYSFIENEFPRLSAIAALLGPVSMLEQLRECDRTRKYMSLKKNIPQ